MWSLKSLCKSTEDLGTLAENEPPTERSRKGTMDGLRSFIETDNHSGLEVGHLRAGLGPFKIQRPKFNEDNSESAKGRSG